MSARWSERWAARSLFALLQFLFALLRNMDASDNKGFKPKNMGKPLDRHHQHNIHPWLLVGHIRVEVITWFKRGAQRGLSLPAHIRYWDEL